MFGNLPHSPRRRDLSKRVKTCRALSGPLPDLATNQKRDAIFFGVHPSGVQQTANDRRCSFRLLISQKPNAPGTSESCCTRRFALLRRKFSAFGFCLSDFLSNFVLRPRIPYLLPCHVPVTPPAVPARTSCPCQARIQHHTFHPCVGPHARQSHGWNVWC